MRRAQARFCTTPRSPGSLYLSPTLPQVRLLPETPQTFPGLRGFLFARQQASCGQRRNSLAKNAKNAKNSIHSFVEAIIGNANDQPADSVFDHPFTSLGEIGRASCRERVCQYV